MIEAVLVIGNIYVVKYSIEYIQAIIFLFFSIQIKL